MMCQNLMEKFSMGVVKLYNDGVVQVVTFVYLIC